MCISPVQINGVTVRCSKCWQCRKNKVQDWVGRCIAESRTASRTLFATLTYGGGDHPAATVLTYSHVQKFFKRMRKDGYRFRYLVAGEYGSRKGRAHWHVIFFFDGRAPEYELGKNVACEFWDHGHTFWENANIGAFHYVCKYVVKELGDANAQAYIAMSKRPFIGRDYFSLLAQHYVDAQLAPQNFYYRFEESRDSNEKLIQHYMHGSVARHFLAEYVARWEKKFGNDYNMPNSDIVDAYLDSLVAFGLDPRFEERRYGLRPYFVPDGAVAEWEELLNTYVIEIDGIRYLWLNREGDGTVGRHSWRSAHGHEIEYKLPLEPATLPVERDPTRYEILLQRLDSALVSSDPKPKRRYGLPMKGELWLDRPLRYRDEIVRRFLVEHHELEKRQSF